MDIINGKVGSLAEAKKKWRRRLGKHRYRGRLPLENIIV
jgi:hypothetical protein